MRVRTARWVADWIAAGSIALIAGGIALAYLDRHLLSAAMTTWDFSDVLDGVTELAIPVIGFVIASRRPGNRIGWLFLAAGLAMGVNVFSQSYGLRALLAAPGSLPAGRAAMWLSNWTLVVPSAFSLSCCCFSRRDSYAHGGGVLPHDSWAVFSPCGR